jgi:hypothetical protein
MDAVTDNQRSSRHHIIVQAIANEIAKTIARSIITARRRAT